MYILTITKIQFILINVFVVFLFGLFYKKYGTVQHFYFINNEQYMNTTDAMYFSLNTYATLGNNNIYPKTTFMKKIIMLQIFCLLCMIVILGCSNIKIIQKN